MFMEIVIVFAIIVRLNYEAMSLNYSSEIWAIWGITCFSCIISVFLFLHPKETTLWRLPQYNIGVISATLLLPLLYFSNLISANYSNYDSDYEFSRWHIAFWLSITSSSINGVMVILTHETMSWWSMSFRDLMGNWQTILSVIIVIYISLALGVSLEASSVNHQYNILQSIVIFFSIGTTTVFSNTKLQPSFTISEFSILSTIISLLLTKTFWNLLYTLRLVESFGCLYWRSEADIVIDIGISGGVLMSGLVWIWYIPPSQNQSRSSINIASYYGSIFLFALATFAVMGYLMSSSPDPTYPLMWLLHYICSNNTALALIGWWILCLAVVFNYPPHYWNLRLIIARKIYHLVAVLMFLPALYLESEFLHLSFAVGLVLLLVTEYLRLLLIPPFGLQIHIFMSRYIDNRDKGILIMSHIYLLLGCLLPMRFAPAYLFDFSKFSGVVVLGVGDALAAVIGSSFGRGLWPYQYNGNRKTFIGSIASIVGNFIVFIVIFSISTVTVQDSYYPGKLVLLSALVSLTETYVVAIDNLVLPLFSIVYIILVLNPA